MATANIAPIDPNSTPFFGADDIMDDLDDGLDTGTGAGDDDDDDLDDAAGDTDDDGAGDPADDPAGADGDADKDDPADDKADAAGDSDGDGAADADADADPADQRPAIMVPKARLDDALKRARRAEELLKSRSQPAGDRPTPLNLDELDVSVDAETAQKMFDAAIDGKMDVAHNLLSQVMGTTIKGSLSKVVTSLRDELRSELASTVNSTLTDNTSAQTFEEAVETVYTNFPFLNPQSETFDATIMEDAITFQQGFEARGYSSAEAVLLATEKALKIHRPEALADTPTTETRTARPAAKPDQASLKRNAAAAKAQPATTDGSMPNKGREAEEVDIDALSDEEFDALPLATRRRLRGDFG